MYHPAFQTSGPLGHPVSRQGGIPIYIYILYVFSTCFYLYMHMII